MSEQIQEQLLDRANALARVGGDLDLLKEIAALFLDEYPRELDEIRTALASGDAHTLERSAHGLKGAVANFGARPAVDAAFQLEQFGIAANTGHGGFPVKGGFGGGYQHCCLITYRRFWAIHDIV